MKQKLIELLTTKFGVGAKVVEGIAEKLAKTVSTEEEAKTVADGVTFAQVLESYADKRANEASETARKNAISKYEETYRIKDGKPVEAPKPLESTPLPTQTTPSPKRQEAPKQQEGSQPKEDEVPQYIKDLIAKSQAAAEERESKLLDTINGLKSEIGSMKAAKLAESRQSILNKEIASLSAAQRNPYARIALDSMSDDEFNTFIEETKADVASIVKDSASAKVVTNRPFMGNIPTDGKKATPEEVKAVVGKIL